MNKDRTRPIIDKFPETFGLRNAPHRIFRISELHSYVNDNNEVMLYTEILNAKGKWLTYAKCTEQELLQQILTGAPYGRTLEAL